MATDSNRTRLVGVISAGILGVAAFGVTTSVNAAPDPGKTSAGPFGTVSIDPPSIATVACSLATAPAPGIKSGDHVLAQAPVALETGLESSGATIQDTDGSLIVRLCNVTAAAIDGAPRNWDYLVLR
jgi:hypothetical protein